MRHQVRPPAQQDKLDEREAWHKIVVKILSWKNGLTDSGVVDLKDKITPSEWDTYYQGLIKINIIHGKEKTIKKLEEIKKTISKHGGFKN